MEYSYAHALRAAIVVLFALVFFALATPAHAASNAAAAVTTFGETLKASSTPTVIIGLNLASTTENLTSVSVAFLGSGGFSTTTDLAALSTATSSGVALYRDDKLSGTQGVLDAADDVVPLSGAAWNMATTTLTIVGTGDVVPVDDSGANAGNDYFIVIQTALNAANAHGFTANMYPGSIGWSVAAPVATPLAMTTHGITLDTIAPALDANTTGPANNSTGVPVSTFIHFGFSENLDQSTLNSSNITLTSNGTPVGAAIRPFPNGFDIIVSSPPTYTASARFAKATTGGTGFFAINGTNPFIPQGAYNIPVVGDIVYTQLDTFPPFVGIVTNAATTSGIFAVNDSPAFKPLQITKFRTASSTGAVSSTALQVGVGDLIVAFTTGNPSDNKYNWHIVTAAGAISAAGLHLDGSSGQPAFQNGSSFSSLLPTATSTVSAGGTLNASTTFAAGDLVFAKLSAGGDNLNAYAWHLVTAITGAGVLGPQGGGGTVSLDGQSPTFAASSVLAKLSSAAQGPAGFPDATAFSMGDLMFSSVAANSANTGSYAFHLVSNGGTGATSTTLRLDNASANLATSSTYTAQAGLGVKDLAGNPLASSASISFTTGSTGGTNTTPPGVMNSQPQQGNQSFAPNGKIKLTFSQAMLADGTANAVNNTAVVKLSNSINGQPGTATSTSLSYDSSTNTLTITPTANLPINTDLVVQVLTAAKTTTGISLPMEYRLYFRTTATLDTTAPAILGLNPVNNSTNISRSQIFGAGVSKDLDPSTVNSSTVTLVTQTSSTTVAGTVSYSQQSRSINFTPSTQLAASTGYYFSIGAGLTGPADLSGNRFAATSTATTTTTSVDDATAPVVQFAATDNFGVAITFSEPVKTGGGPNAADNIVNYTLESPVGSSISLGGKTIAYDAGSKTVRISGISLQNGNQFKVTVAVPVQDLAGNGVSTSGTPPGNLAFGTVQSSSSTGGNLGPGTGTIDQSMQGMNPTRITPQTRLAGAISNYHVEFLAGSSIPSTGQIVLTFPSGFDVTNATTVPTTTSFCNADMNGPATGAMLIAANGVAGNNGSGTVTITTDNAPSGANSFICFDIGGIVNSPVPSSSGYTIDIKTRDTAVNNRAVLDTKTTPAFYLGTPGSRTLTVNVFKDSNGNGVKDGGEGVSSVNVFLFSPASGGSATSTNALGVATFNSLTDGDYMLGLDPGSAGTGVFFNSAPQPFTVSATSLTKNFALTASLFTISGSVTGPAGTKVDVFGSSPNGFVKKTLTLSGGADSYSLPVASSTTYQLGVGPAMPDTAFTPGAPPPPPPTFTFMPPPNTTVSVATTSVSGQNFVLAATSKTITGVVRDSSGNAVSNAGVFARPISSSTSGGSSVGFGSGGQTGTNGSFTLNVIPGVYLVGVAKPGMPSISDQQITVPSNGANIPASLTFKLGAGTSLTISGTVKDDSGNAVPYAGVGGRKVVSTSDLTPIGGTTGNFVGGPADSNGAYTLYVDAGVWALDAFAPGFGKLGSKTVTVTTSSLSGQDFSAATLNLGTITGSTTKATIAQQGVMVRAQGSAGANMAISDASGSYSLKVPPGTYTVSCFFPGVGDTTPLTGVAVTANTTTTGKDCTMSAPITLTVRLTDGANPIANAYVDARGSSGLGNGASQNTTSGIYAVYTLNVPPGTYTVRAGHPAYGMIGSTAGVSSTQTITYTTTAGSLFAVTGTVSNGAGGLGTAWVSLTGAPTGQTNTITVGGQTDSTGAFSIQVPAGVYSFRADKPGYISSPAATFTITGNKFIGATTLTAASQTISGTVTLNNAGVSGAFVDASDGSGGFAVAQTDSSGAYSLSVKNGAWSLNAHSQGYSGGPLSVAVSNNSPSGQTITLSAISGFTVKAEHQETVTPTAGGNLTNSDIGDAFKLNIPANALGTGSNAGTVTSQVNTALPNTANGTVLSKSGVSISAVDSSGQPIKNLNDSVTIVVPYSDSDVPAGTSEANLQLGVWNDATQSYDILSTTVDTANNTLTATVSHFSDFAPIAPSASSGSSNSSSGSSSSSSGSSSSGGGGGGGGGIATNLPTAKAQIIYPDGRVVYVDQNGGSEKNATSASAKASALSNIAVGTSVSGRFVATLKRGSKGADVARLQKLLGVEASSNFGPLTAKAVQSFQLKYGLAKKGDEGFGMLGPKTRAKMEEVFGSASSADSTSSTDSPQASSGQASAGTGGFARALKVGSTGNDVKLLQVILNTDADTRVAAEGDGAPGKETTKVGKLTLKALQRFQAKYGIAKPGDDGYGNLGPRTRTKLNEMLSAWLAAHVPAPAGANASASSSSGVNASSTPLSSATSTAPGSASAGSTNSPQASTTVSASASVAATTTAGY